MNKAPILFNQSGQLGEILLNRPQAYNALNGEMIRLLADQLNLWRNDPSITAVLIHSCHEKVFCAGGDIKQVYEKGQSDPKTVLDFFQIEYALNAQIRNYPKPYIALMNGLNFGGGVGISVYASYRIASEKFAFAMPETAIGFFPDIGASYFLSRRPDASGIYLALTGERLNACEAKQLQFVDYASPQTDYDDLLNRLRQLNQYDEETLTHFFSSLPLLTQTTQLDLPLINHFFKAKSLHAIFENLEKSELTWAKTTLAALKRRSPLSLQVTFEQLERAKHLDFSDCQKMELRLLKHFLAHREFYEGVRAAVIDKDQQAHWTYDNIDAVPREIVLNFFKD